jgi:hypothetical protein
MRRSAALIEPWHAQERKAAFARRVDTTGLGTACEGRLRPSSPGVSRGHRQEAIGGRRTGMMIGVVGRTGRAVVSNHE